MSARRGTRPRLLPAMPPYAWVVSLLAALAIGIALRGLAMRLPGDAWLQSIWNPDPADVRQMLAYYSVLPRVAVSLLAGAMLALSGTLLQQMLRNPLADPTTLGISSGAYLAITCAGILLPGLSSIGQEQVALLGASAALAMTFGLAWRQRFSTAALILAGLIVSLYCGTLTAILTLFHREQLTSAFVWGSGSLTQDGWRTAIGLSWRLVGAGLCAAILLRPLDLMAAGDDVARGAGVSVITVRIMALLLALLLAASVVSAVGVIAFIGFVTPALVRSLGARRFRDQLMAAPPLGAALLCLVDQLVQIAGSLTWEWPTGTATALLGAPLLLVLLAKGRAPSVRHARPASGPAARLHQPWTAVGVGILLLAAMAWLAVGLGESSAGWRWIDPASADPLLHWRIPRATAAAAAGMMLAISGVIMQRMTGNAMASPEVLGIGAGASLAVILLAWTVQMPTPEAQLGAAALGAAVTLASMLSLGRRSAYAPERMLLTGIALGTLLGTVITAVMATGDPRIGPLLSWMAGSTYRVTSREAIVAAAAATAALASAPFAARWLDILPLGEGVAQARGVALARSRLLLLLLTALLTGAATLITGPMSFVGLMAPHMARMLGMQRAMTHVYASAVLGGIIMLVADWLGRNLLFPYQVPAGLFATLVGGPYLMWLLCRREE